MWLISLRSLALSIAISLAFASGASAQGASDAAATEALFASGTTALSEGRFPDAQRIFEQVLARTPHRGAAFNLAVALRGQGRMTRAGEVLRQLLHGDYGALGDEQRSGAEAMLDEVQRSLVELVIRVRGAREGVVSIDAREVASLAGEDALRERVDPGPHLVEVSTPDGRSARQRIDAVAVEGAQLSVELAVPPPVEAADDEDDRGGVLRSPWTWILVGAALVAGGVALAVVLLTAEDEPAVPDFLGRRVEVLSW